MLRIWRAALPLFGFVAVACGGSSASELGGADDYGAMFGAPSTAQTTPDTLDGLWGGNTSSDGILFDIRMRFSATALTVANRCHFSDGKILTAGVSVAAAVDSDDHTITVKESQTKQAVDGDDRCSVSTTPEASSYVLDGTKLRITREGTAAALDLVKLSD